MSNIEVCNKLPTREGTDHERSANDQGSVRQGFRIGNRNTPHGVKDNLRLFSHPFPLSSGEF